MGKLPGLILCGSLGLSAALPVTPVLAAVTQPADTPANIPAEPLALALAAFARQTGLQLIYVSGAAEGHNCVGAPAGLSVSDTLTRLLQGTGLSFEFINDRTVRIFAPERRAGTRAVRTALVEGDSGGASPQLPAGSAAAAAPGDTSERLAPQLQEITVTAEKRSEDIQSAAAAITQVSGADLATLGFQSITDMSGLFPSARFENAGPVTHLYVRGIGAEQDRIAVDQLVNMSMDGVLLPREMDSVAQFDVHDVELLPGPQGTLYGASSVGGVVTIQNNRPTQVAEDKLLMEFGNYATFHVDNVVNVPVNEQLALRGAVDYVRHSAYQTTNAWTADAVNARLGVLFTPSERFSAYVWGQVTDDDSVPADSGVIGHDGQLLPAGDPWDIANACITKACNGVFGRSDFGPVVPNAQSFRHYVVAGQFDWHLDSLTLTDIPALLDSHVSQNWYGTMFPFSYDVTNHQLSNELKLSNTGGGRAQWLAGLFLYRNTASQIYVGSSYDLPQFTLDNVAPYGQLTWSFSDRLRGVAGARYSWTRKSGTFALPYVLPQTTGTWSAVDWKAGLEYDLGANAMTYLTAQTGSSPGTLDAQDPVDGQPSLTKLTRLYSLTGGWKSKLFDNRLQFNNELFYYDYKNFLIQTIICAADPCTSFNNVFLNAPKLVSWGDQLDLRWQISAADRVEISPAYTSVKTGHWITSAGADLSDQTLFEAPQVTVTFGGQHVFSMSNGGSTVLRLDSSIVNGYWGDFGTQPGTPVHCGCQHQRAFSVSGATLTYHAPGERWTLGLWARNLENKAQIGPGAAFTFGPIGGGGAMATAPRTFGIRFTANLQFAPAP